MDAGNVLAAMATPQSSEEDLRTAALAGYLLGSGGGPQEKFATDNSTVTSETHQITEPSRNQPGYCVAEHRTDQTSISSELGKKKPTDSNESLYDSASELAPPSKSSPSNSDEFTRDLPKPSTKNKISEIGRHLQLANELHTGPQFHQPTNEKQAKVIRDKMKRTHVQMDANLRDGPGQIWKQGESYQVSVRPSQSVDQDEENEDIDISNAVEGHVNQANAQHSHLKQQEHPNRADLDLQETSLAQAGSQSSVTEPEVAESLQGSLQPSTTLQRDLVGYHIDPHLLDTEEQRPFGSTRAARRKSCFCGLW
ncbi:hypothetical protein N7G274_003079 [Stereocaulon virgatum]|uniref:Uncharacterized protein n=1 Tax=Stereocaulon virgatum TaxID=373712 RepID=A0ABR4AI29_9LECA